MMSQPKPPAHRLAVGGMIVVCLSLTACRPAVEENLHPVQGAVFVDGQPAAGALVVFAPIHQSQSEQPVVGRVADDGQFQLTTHSRNDGALPGVYEVAVIWREQLDEDEEPGRYLAPRRYANPKTSGLKVQIQEGPNELKPFHLTK